ncbi:N-acetyltransferase [Xanthobacteraceae bacterium A53D]
MIHTLWAGSSNADLNDALAGWCATHIGLPRPFEGPYVTMGVFNGDVLIAAVVFNNWNPEAGVIEFHGAGTSPRWLARQVLREMFAYPFKTLGCQMVVTRNSARNTRLHRQLSSYGFQRFLIPRLRGRDEDEIVWTLTDDGWLANGFS